MDLALRNGAPVIGLNDSGGARIQEGVASLGGYADIFLRNTLASGVVPQISAILGPCAGGAVYSPAITDFIFMVRGVSYMFVTGPNVVKTVTHEEVTFEELGGADVHGGDVRRGALRRTTPSPSACSAIRELLGFLPLNNLDDPPRGPPTTRPTARDEALLDVDPRQPQQALRHARRDRARGGRRRASSRCSADYADNIVVGFARLGGRPVGVVANQPAVLAGRARHQRLGQGGALHPLLRLLQHPARHLRGRARASCPGVAQEHGGIIRHGAKLLYAYCEATVPKLTVITRKAYGGAYDVMSSKHIRGDLNLAWPTAEIAVMGPKGAVEILFKDEIAKAGRSRGRHRAADRGVHREVRQPVRGGGARLHRRRDRPAGHPAAADRRAADAADQAGPEPAQEAREHPALAARPGSADVP